MQVLQQAGLRSPRASPPEKGLTGDGKQRQPGDDSRSPRSAESHLRGTWGRNLQEREEPQAWQARQEGGSKHFSQESGRKASTVPAGFRPKVGIPPPLSSLQAHIATMEWREQDRKARRGR